MAFEGRQRFVDSRQQLDLLRVCRHRHPDASTGKAHIGHQSVGLLVKVQEVPAIEMKGTRPGFAQRGVSSQHPQQRLQPGERLGFHAPPAKASIFRCRNQQNQPRYFACSSGFIQSLPVIVPRHAGLPQRHSST